MAVIMAVFSFSLFESRLFESGDRASNIPVTDDRVSLEHGCSFPSADFLHYAFRNARATQLPGSAASQVVNQRSLEAGRLCKITPGRAETAHGFTIVAREQEIILRLTRDRLPGENIDALGHTHFAPVLVFRCARVQPDGPRCEAHL